MQMKRRKCDEKSKKAVKKIKYSKSEVEEM